MTTVPEGTDCEMEWRSHGVEGSWHCYGPAIAYRDINGKLVAMCRDCLYDMDQYDDEFERWAVLDERVA